MLSVLDCVYVDAKKARSIVFIKPKPPVIPVFHVAVLKEGSNIQLNKQTHPLAGADMGRVSGGVEGGLNYPPSCSFIGGVNLSNIPSLSVICYEQLLQGCN